MTVPVLTAVPLAGRPDRPLLLVVHSIGTSSRSLWAACAARLGETFRVVGVDLPGHGESAAATAPFDMAELARAVVGVADGLGAATFALAGVSIGGQVTLQVVLDAPDRLTGAALLCTGAVIAGPETWRERAELVRREGTGATVTGSEQRWFGPGFSTRRPDVTGPLLAALRATDPESYAAGCDLLAGFDARSRLDGIEVPLLAVAGSDDAVCPPAALELIARGVRHGRFAELAGVAHQAPAEAPEAVADLLRDHLGRPESPFERGMSVRRAVLGDAHVDRATAGPSGFAADFQDLITRYAWGEIWTRPGLDRRSRSLVTLSALVAGGHHEELVLHLRAARRNGLTVAEIKEVLLQCAIYCGVPAANTAFRIAQQVLAEDGEA